MATSRILFNSLLLSFYCPVKQLIIQELLIFLYGGGWALVNNRSWTFIGDCFEQSIIKIPSFKNYKAWSSKPTSFGAEYLDKIVLQSVLLNEFTGLQ